MGISIFPSTAAEFVSNNFVVDMNDTTNNVATDIGGVKQAGPYSMTFSSGDTSFDVYLINEDGDSVGYSNTTSITASGLFDTVVILGVASDEIISFQYQGSVNNADETGTEPGAGAYLTSISPADLPSIDDTATVIGGNFGTATEITFESGTISLPAKNITVTNGTSIVVTRPDALIEDDAPYDLKAINTGVTPPTGSDAHILAGTVTAGSDPTWVTSADLALGTINTAYLGTLVATDSDGTVTDYSVTAGSLPTGISLDSSTGVLSGTPTASGQTFTVTATDDGGNTTPKEFNLAIQKATGGTITTIGSDVLHTFETTDDLVVDVNLEVDYLIVGGGGSGGQYVFDFVGFPGGGGGGGGVRSTFSADASPESKPTLTAGTITVSVAAADGDSSLGAIQTSIAGGKGGERNVSYPGKASGQGADGAAGGGSDSGTNGRPGGLGSNGGNGGAHFSDGGSDQRPGGGGGGGPSGTNGVNGVSGVAGAGGTGTISTITGTSVRHGDGGNGGQGTNGSPGEGKAGGQTGLVIVRYA